MYILGRFFVTNRILLLIMFIYLEILGYVLNGFGPGEEIAHYLKHPLRYPRYK